MKLTSALIASFFGCCIGISLSAAEVLAQAYTIVNGSGSIFVQYDPIVLDPANNPPPTGTLNPSTIDFPINFSVLTPSGVVQQTVVTAITNPNTGSFASFERNGGECGTDCYRVTFADSGTLTGSASGNLGGQIAFVQVSGVFIFTTEGRAVDIDFGCKFFEGPSIEKFNFDLIGGSLAITTLPSPPVLGTNINLVKDSTTTANSVLPECSPINVSRIYPAVNCANF